MRKYEEATQTTDGVTRPEMPNGDVEGDHGDGKRAPDASMPEVMVSVRGKAVHRLTTSA